MSELSPSVKGIRAGVAGIAATAALLSGCSISINSEPTTTSHPKAAVPKAPTETTPSTPETAWAYFNTAGRNQRLDAVVQAFGGKILAASQDKNNAWGVFDTFCATDNGTGSTEGWLSQGFIPQAGDACYVQHNPQYGGSSTSNQVVAEGLIGPNGYTGQFVDGEVDTPGCDAVSISYDTPEKTWDSSYFDPTNNTAINTITASTVSQAEAVDNLAISCLTQAVSAS